MTSSQHGLYAQGYTRATMAGTTGCKRAISSQSLKTGLSSDWRLQFASMKLELLVNVNQPCRVEYVPGACTHRPSHHPSLMDPKSLPQPLGEGGA